MLIVRERAARRSVDAEERPLPELLDAARDAGPHLDERVHRLHVERVAREDLARVVHHGLLGLDDEQLGRHVGRDDEVGDGVTVGEGVHYASDLPDVVEGGHARLASLEVEHARVPAQAVGVLVLAIEDDVVLRVPCAVTAVLRDPLDGLLDYAPGECEDVLLGRMGRGARLDQPLAALLAVEPHARVSEDLERGLVYVVDLRVREDLQPEVDLVSVHRYVPLRRMMPACPKDTRLLTVCGTLTKKLGASRGSSPFPPSLNPMPDVLQRIPHPVPARLRVPLHLERAYLGEVVEFVPHCLGSSIAHPLRCFPDRGPGTLALRHPQDPLRGLVQVGAQQVLLDIVID